MDALAIAGNAILGWYIQTGHDPSWHSFSIMRLLTGGGWMVSGSQTAIVLERHLEGVTQ